MSKIAYLGLLICFVWNFVCFFPDTRERRRIGFLCINSGNIKNADKETTVVFDKTLTNIGNGYNQNNGYFTAPVEGLYSFSWTIATNAKSTFHTYLEMNGEDLGRNAVGRVDNYSTSGSQSVMLHLVTNDTVCVKTLYSYNQRGLMHGAGLSSFSGFLIAWYKPKSLNRCFWEQNTVLLFP